MAEKDAQSLRRIEDLKQQGLWLGNNALPRPQREPQKPVAKAHWDFLLEEMEFMSKDFRAERQRKLMLVKKAARACAKAIRRKQRAQEQAAREEEAELRRRAGMLARCIKGFWSQIGKIVQYKLQARIDSERSEAITKHLDFVVGQTTKLSAIIAKDLQQQKQQPPQSRPRQPSESPVPSKSPLSSRAGDENEEEADGGEENNEEEVVEEQTKSELTSREKVERAAEEATAAQPTGTTLATTKVKTPLPALLRGTLREYQHVGLDWLAAMYEKNLNVILADEMGLGKTVMTIALLAHLACEKGVWGPHLIIVPSSTVMNWELELKKWCPALKVITYVGSKEERLQKRTGWSKDNAMHVCITSYTLAVLDSAVLRRRRWCYMILDEAQNIKNFRSQRWNVLLQYHNEHRLLLTGTPLQNSVMELWSLMHFLMPAVFASHSEFSSWFSVPLTSMVERGGPADAEIISRLHSVLRPFLLRRVKRDVEYNLPPKHEIIVRCKLSRRQQYLYEEFINAAPTQETLASGNFLGVANVLMQLRKVCNHPDLFTPRPTGSPFDILEPIELVAPAAVMLDIPSRSLPSLALVELETRSTAVALEFSELTKLASAEIMYLVEDERELWQEQRSTIEAGFLDDFARERARLEHEELFAALTHIANVNERRRNWCMSLFGGESLRELLTVRRKLVTPVAPPSLEQLVAQWELLATHYMFLHAKARTRAPKLVLTHATTTMLGEIARNEALLLEALRPLEFALEPMAIRLMMHFPDKRLLQYDCGKLQELAPLLQRLHDEGHKAVLFTQMTTMLDIVEIFANLHRYTYLRLDGSTKVERRQILIERFNRDPRIFLFLSTPRSGGFGINLTGADTVIFYDSDWNPAVDAQAQDRCHRIGQTREVTIYRFVTESTVEENILKKAQQKKALNRIVIKEGSFTTDFLAGLGLENLIKQPHLRAQAASRPWLGGGGGGSGGSGKAETEQDVVEALAHVGEEPGEKSAELEEERAMQKEFGETPPVPSSQSQTPLPPVSPLPAEPLGKRRKTVEKTMGDIAAEDEMLAEAVAAGMQPHTLESELSPLQRYGVRFLESLDPIAAADGSSQVERLRAELEAREREWNVGGVTATSPPPTTTTAAAAATTTSKSVIEITSSSSSSSSSSEEEEVPKRRRGRPPKKQKTPRKHKRKREDDEENGGNEEEDAN